MKEIIKRALALFLILTMTVSMIPVFSFAEEAEGEEMPDEFVISEDLETTLDEQDVFTEPEEGLSDKEGIITEEYSEELFVPEDDTDTFTSPDFCCDCIFVEAIPDVRSALIETSWFVVGAEGSRTAAVGLELYAGAERILTAEKQVELPAEAAEIGAEVSCEFDLAEEDCELTPDTEYRFDVILTVNGKTSRYSEALIYNEETEQTEPVGSAMFFTFPDLEELEKQLAEETEEITETEQATQEVFEAEPAEEINEAATTEKMTEKEPAAEEIKEKQIPVTFVCGEEDLTGIQLCVFCGEELVLPADGVYYLLPGEYSYTAESESFSETVEGHFSVGEDANTLEADILTGSVKEICLETEESNELLAGESNDSGTCGANGDDVVWSLDSMGNLAISGTGEMSDFSDNKSPWNNRKGDIFHIRIEEGVTSIGKYAFEDCEFVQSVEISAGVTRVGDYAFSGCGNISLGVFFSGSAPVIGQNAFKDVFAEVSYPFGDDTWTDSVRINYGGNLTWVEPMDEDVDYNGCEIFGDTGDLNLNIWETVYETDYQEKFDSFQDYCLDILNHYQNKGKRFHSIAIAFRENTPKTFSADLWNEIVDTHKVQLINKSVLTVYMGEMDDKSPSWNLYGLSETDSSVVFTTPDILSSTDERFSFSFLFTEFQAEEIYYKFGEAACENSALLEESRLSLYDSDSQIVKGVTAKVKTFSDYFTIDYFTADSEDSVLQSGKEYYIAVSPPVHKYESREAAIQAIRDAIVSRELGFDDTRFYLAGQFSVPSFDEIYDFLTEREGMKPTEGDYLHFQLLRFGMSDGSDADGYYWETYAEYFTDSYQEKQVDEKVKAILDSTDFENAIFSGSNDLMARTSFDYVVSHCRGAVNDRYAPISHSAYCAFVEGKGTCEAQALAMYRLCREMSVPCKIIMGTDPGAHTYTIVRFDDGFWYYVDPSANIWKKDYNSFSRTTEQGEFRSEEFVENYISKIKNYYSIKFSANGGSGTAPTVLYDEEGIIHAANKYTRTGYAFIGWNTAADGSGTNCSEAFTMQDISPDATGRIITLYAQWRPISYMICYDANGGDGEMPASPMTFGIKGTLADCTFTKEGYIFAGWNTKADGKGTSYGKNALISNLAKTEGAELTMYAKWTAATFKIVFEANGGTGKVSPVSITYDKASSKLPASGFKKAGWVLKGWSEAPHEDVVEYSADFKAGTALSAAQVDELYAKRNTDNTVNLYAVWGPTEYKITYKNFPVYGKGSVEVLDNSMNPEQFCVQKKPELYPPIVPGYTFNGWYADSKLTNPVTEAFWTGAAKNVYAKLTPISYSISYDLEEGTEPAKGNKSVYTIKTAVALNSPTKAGYTFAGWYLGETKVSKLASGTYYGGDIKLVAHWTANSYTLVLNGNGGTVSGQTKFIGLNTESSVTLPPLENRGLYTFEGWSTGKDATGDFYPAGVTAISAAKDKATITLYAVWSYNLTFDANGGEGSMSAQKLFLNQPAALNAGAFTRTGYTFAGWNTSKTAAEKGTVQYRDGVSVKNLAGKTLYAVWKPITYKVIFHINNGVKEITKIQSIGYDKSVVLLVNTVIRKGYVFKGWSVTSDSYECKYKDKEIVRNLSSDNNGIIDLYAVWERETYTITYVLNGGEMRNAAPKDFNVETPTFVLPNPEREGFTFAGWYSDSSFKTKITQVTKGTVGSIELYAKWNANKYSIEFNGNGAVSGNIKTMLCEYGKTYLLPNNQFIRNLYRFGGWNTKPDGSGEFYSENESINSLSKMPNGNVTLYAIWIPVINIILQEELPHSYNLYNSYNEEILTTFLADECWVEWEKPLYRDNYNVTIFLHGTKTYCEASLPSTYFCDVRYKLKELYSGNIIQSGKFSSSTAIEVGDSFNMSIELYNVPEGDYYLELLDNPL